MTVWFALSFIFIDSPRSLLHQPWPHFPTAVIALGVFIGTRQLAAEPAASIITIL